MTAYSSNASGNWATSTIWTPNGIPGAGDSVTINAHTVTVTADTIIGTSGVAGTAAVAATTNGGKLVVTGCKLTLRGDLNLGVYNSGTILEYLQVNPSGSTQGGLEFDPPTGVRYVINAIIDGKMSFNGTSSGHTYLRTKSGAAGSNVRVLSASASRAGLITATYTDFTAVGDASNGFNDTVILDFTLTTFSCTNCTFTSCGLLTISASDTDARLVLDTCIWTSTVSTVLLTIASSTVTTGSRLVNGNSFDKQVHFYGPTGLTITSNYFALGYDATATPWATFSGNFCLITTTVNSLPIEANTSGNYWYSDTSQASNPHFCGPASGSAQSAMTMDGEIFEYGGTDVSGDCILASGPASAFVLTVQHCIKLPNSSGGSSGTLVSMLGSANFSLIANHNTIHGGGTLDSSGVRFGETYAGYAGMVQSFKSNLYWDTTAQGYIFYALSTSTIADVVTGANCDYNGKYNAATGTHNTINGTTLQSLVGYENIDITASPGAHDVVGNPSFVDNTRCLAAWAVLQGSVAGTNAGKVADALSYIAANPALVSQATTGLVPWIRAGFAPTNTALQGTAHDGTDIGAVAVPLSTLTVTASTSGTSCVLNWDTDPLTLGYLVSRSSSKLGDSVLIATVPAGTTTYTDTSPSVGNNFYEVVSMQATPGNNGLTVTIAGSGNSAVLTWAPDALAVNYKIYRSATIGGDATLLGTVSASTTTYTDTSPLLGANYYAIVSTL